MSSLRVSSVLRSLARLSLPRSSSVLFRPTRSFSVSPRALNVSAELSEALKEEILAEKELEKQGGPSPTFPGFTLTVNEAEVRLTKKHGNEDILVVFNVNHSVDIAEEVQGEPAPPPVALPPFTIEITKGDQRLCFHLELVEAEQEGEYDFNVEEFYIAPAVKGNEEDVAAHVYATSGKYIDPNIQELLYIKYLEERGFDGPFLANLVQFASTHEHRLYIGLLDKIKAFIAK